MCYNNDVSKRETNPLLIKIWVATNAKEIDTMTTSKMTNRSALTFVMDNYDLPDEVHAKLTAMIAALDKKNGAERKPTAKQTENADLRAQFVAYINDHAEGNGVTCGEIAKECGLSSQKVSAILRQAVLAGEISRGTVKRVTYFAPVGVYEVEGE